MLLVWSAVLIGLVLLVWSADRFVDGASAMATHAGMSPLLIGMLIIGFGTSAPEMVVSAIAAFDGSPGLALGNAYGSNITNIGLVLGLVAAISPIRVQSRILTKELPLLLAVTFLAGLQLLNGKISRLDAVMLLIVFFGIMTWSVIQGKKHAADPLGADYAKEVESHTMSLGRAFIWVLIGLILLVIGSRLLVWGSVIIAKSFGVSDVVIGLTVVAVGTSLPELASAVAAIRKNEHELALGNILGSGLFNTLVVVGIAGSIQPLDVDMEVLYRDWVVMALLTIVLLVMGIGWRGRQGRIGRLKGTSLFLAYLGYTGYLVSLVLR